MDKILGYLNPIAYLSLPILLVVCLFAALGVLIFGRQVWYHTKRVRRTRLRVAELVGCAVCTIILIVVAPVAFDKWQERQDSAVEAAKSVARVNVAVQQTQPTFLTIQRKGTDVRVEFVYNSEQLTAANESVGMVAGAWGALARNVWRSEGKNCTEPYLVKDEYAIYACALKFQVLLPSDYLLADTEVDEKGKKLTLINADGESLKVKLPSS